ncbi:MAG: putative glycoside hydrolase [Oscillospiraceae bacterium]|nr:putative glycoside hydrolase [Oscillospiraceae bacterium]
MKIRPKGRKIYRHRTAAEKLRDFGTNTASLLGTLLAASVMVIVGYSAGKPLLQFLNESRILAVPNEVQETLPLTEPPTEAPVTETETAAPTTEPEPQQREAPEMQGYILPEDSLTAQSPFEEAVKAIPEGTTHVFVPLKTKGGYLYYATDLQDAAKSGAVRAALPLTSIYEAIAAKGAEPVALINTLEDSVYPQSYPDSAYRYAGSDELWLDTSPENGGKPMLSPFKEMTLDYLGNIAAEIKAAGFESIACDGLRFPDFTEEELSRLDSRVGQNARYTALTAVVEAMRKAAPHMHYYTLVSGTDILNNRSDAIAASNDIELEAILCKVDSLSAANVEMLRTLPDENPVVFIWDGVSVPESEKSYIRYAE